MTTRNRILTVLTLAAVAMASLAFTAPANAGTIISSGKVASGTITGDTIMVINSPGTSELPLSTSGPLGPNWVDNSADGFRLTAGHGTDGGTQGTSPWEPDGASQQGQHRFHTNGVSTTYTFNLADAGIDLPDGAVINAIYATWTTRGVSGATYSYTEGAQNGSFLRTHTSGPNADLQLNWTDSGSTVRTANFERIFNTAISVQDGNGFTLNVARSGNTHQTDAIVLDVTVPEPATMGLLVLGGLGVLARRRRRS